MKKPSLKVIIIAIFVAILIGGSAWAIISLTNVPGNNYQETTVSRATVTKEIKAYGQVKAAEDVDLDPERSGKIVSASVKVGDQVKAGQTIFALDNSDLGTQIQQAQANLLSAQAGMDQLQAALDGQNSKLQDMKNGARPEEIAIKQAQLDQAKSNLKSQYDNTLVALNDAYAKADQAIHQNTDYLFTNPSSGNAKLIFLSSNSQSTSATENERNQIEAILNSWKSDLTNAKNNPSPENIEAMINPDKTKLNTLRDYLDDLLLALNSSVSVDPTALANYKLAVNTSKTLINAAAAEVNAQDQAIAGQKTALQTAQQGYDLTVAGYTQDQLDGQVAQVNAAAASVKGQQARIMQAQAALSSLVIQSSKNVIKSPIDGIISKQDAKVGEIALPNVPLASVMSNAKFQIEARVSENDLPNINIGDSANVTLDAYGDNQIFSAKIISKDPAETISGGVASYKIDLQFDNNNDLIKSGMNATVKISAGQKDNVLSLPEASIIKEDNKYYVMKDLNGNSVKTEVTIGLKGSNGLWEIVGGLNEGDKIINFSSK